MINKKIWIMGLVLMFMFLPQQTYAMHIMEGFLPAGWCITWGALAIPFVLAGFFLSEELLESIPKH
ncbi:hypothetical protein [Dehalobacter sp. 14DCB1]|uniref:hypothetical protein n=1 Tax=Dehalobacter sp. 14DCB1 TaxID=2070227 RepID=UPI001FAAE5DD|nr:hypothetical protein [Dehalobacter sp. 14DCB1]